jgi:O-antigen ligase
VTGLIALAQRATGSLPSSGTDVPRFALVGEDPNITAAALLLPLAFCLVGLFETNLRPSRLPFWLYAAAIGTILAAVALTASRTGMAAAVLVIGIVLFRHGSALQRVIFSAMGVLMVAIIDLPFESRTAGLTGRSSIWNIGLLSCRESCWVGSGFGTFPDRHELIVFARPELSSNQFRFEPHNIWIGSLVELGIAATLLLFVLVVYSLVTTYANRESFSAAAFAGLAGVVAANMFVSNIEFKYFWLAMVIAVIACERDDLPLVPSRQDETASMVGV